MTYWAGRTVRYCGGLCLSYIRSVWYPQRTTVRNKTKIDEKIAKKGDSNVNKSSILSCSRRTCWMETFMIVNRSTETSAKDGEVSCDNREII